MQAWRGVDIPELPGRGPVLRLYDTADPTEQKAISLLVQVIVDPDDVALAQAKRPVIGAKLVMAEPGHVGAHERIVALQIAARAREAGEAAVPVGG